MSDRKPSSPRRRELRASTAERLTAIVEAAERAAEKVIDDAEEQARRYLEETRARADREADERLAPLGELTDSLLEKAVDLREQAELLQATLEEARARLEGDEERVNGRRGHLTALDGESDGEPEQESGGDLPARDWSGASAARLLATQMAVSGSTREEIALRLRNGFDIDDPGAILDAILGSED